MPRRAEIPKMRREGDNTFINIGDTIVEENQSWELGDSDLFGEFFVGRLDELDVVSSTVIVDVFQGL